MSIFSLFHFWRFAFVSNAEQQEQLSLIHQKFKEGIHHHLQSCQSTIEELEAHQIELKGTVKKQSMITIKSVIIYFHNWYCC